MTLTLDDLNQLRYAQQITHFHNSDPDAEPNTDYIDPADQKHFKILIHQKLHNLNIAPILDFHPQMKQWYTDITTLAPEIFVSGKKKQFNLTLPCLFEGETLEAKVNLAYRQGNPLLYEWAVRSPELQWHDKVRCFIAQNYLGHNIPITLIILAVHSSKAGQRIEVEWTPQLHEETEEWLRSLLSPQPMTPEPTLPSELWNIDLDQIPEVVL